MPITKIMVPLVPNVAFQKCRKTSMTPMSAVNEEKRVTSLDLNHADIIGRSLVTKPKNAQSTPDLSTILNTLIENDKKSKKPIIKSVHPNFISQFAKKINENPDKNILIGICGESASGKTTICNTIRNTADKENLSIEILSADNYFKDISALISKYGSFDELLKTGYDVDAPTNFDMEQLHDDLVELSNGNDVRIPQYLVNGTGISVPNAIPKQAKKLIVVEGLATMYSPIREILDAQIYVDIDPEIQEKRYVKRAKAERNQTEEEALHQLQYVREAAEKYILPKKDDADITIDGSAPKGCFTMMLKNISGLVKSNQA